MKTKIRLVLFAVFFGALVLLTFFSQANHYFSWDLAISKFLQQWRSPLVDNFWLAISWHGYPPQVYKFTAALIIGMLLLRWYRAAFCEVIGVILLSSVAQWLKHWTNRPRPLEEIIYVFHKGVEGGKYSFPAGHVMADTALLGFLAIIVWLKIKQKWLKLPVVGLCLGMIILMGPSRVYLGEHWTSDIIGGYLMGTLILIIMYTIYTLPIFKNEKKS